MELRARGFVHWTSFKQLCALGVKRLCALGFKWLCQVEEMKRKLSAAQRKASKWKSRALDIAKLAAVSPHGNFDRAGAVSMRTVQGTKQLMYTQICCMQHHVPG